MKLVKGQGSESTGACWMSAVHYYVRKDDKSWSDHPNCVSPIVRELCIQLNDWCEDGERESLIGPHIFAPVGTNTCEADEIRRAFLCADRAVRVFAPAALDVAGLRAEADKLRALSPVVDVRSAKIAANAAETAIASAIASASTIASASAIAWAIVRASTRASTRASARAKQELLQLTLDCCAIGERVEVVPTKSKECVLEYLEKP